MNTVLKATVPLLWAAWLAGSPSAVMAHGNVTPQAVDTTGLESLGEGWREVNPYVGNATAIKIGASAYSANCARCHGLEAVSGGIAPDLRNLPNGKEGDEFFLMRIRNGAIRNGVTYMPKFEGILNQEAAWAIRAWLESISVETVEAAEKAPATPAAAPAATTTPAAAAAPATPAEPAAAVTAPAAPAATTTPATPTAEPAAPAATTTPAAAPPAASAPATASPTPEPAAEPAKTDASTPGKKTELKSDATSTTSQSLNADSQLAKVKAKAMLEVAVYKDFPPYSWTEQGEPKGIDVDIAKALAKRLGVNASIRLVSPGENVEDDLRNNVWKGHYLGGGVADVMLHAPIDRDFANKVEQVSFIAPYQLEQLVFALDSSKVGKEPDLEVFTREPVGVELDTLSDFYLLRALNGDVAAQIRHYKNIPEAIAALKKGEIPAVMGPRGEIEGALKDKPANIVVQRLATPGLNRGASWAMGMAVKASHTELSAALGQAMAELVKEGAIQQIFTAYGLSYEPPAEAPAVASQ